MEGSKNLNERTKFSSNKYFVKQYDNQLSLLKRENFNLKLRIYFIEQKIGSSFPVDDKDNIIKKYIHYQEKAETLTCELNDRENLFHQAVKTLQLEDEEHKKIRLNKESQVITLIERVEELEKQVKLLTDINEELEKKSMQGGQIEMKNINEPQTQDEERELCLKNESDNLMYLQSRFKQSETELKETKTKIKKLAIHLKKKERTITSLSSHLAELKKSFASVVNDMKLNCNEASQKDYVIQQQIFGIEQLQNELDEIRMLYEAERKNAIDLKSQQKERDDTIIDLKKKLDNCKIVIRNLELELLKIVQNKLQTKQQRFQHSKQNSPPKLKLNKNIEMLMKLREDLLANKYEDVFRSDGKDQHGSERIQNFLQHIKNLEQKLSTMKKRKPAKALEMKRTVSTVKNDNYETNESPISTIYFNNKIFDQSYCSGSTSTI